MKPLVLNIDGQERTLGNLAKIYKVRASLIYNRIRYGWTPRQAVGLDERPKQKRQRGPQKRENSLTELATVTAQNAVPLARLIRLAAGKTLRAAGAELGISQSNMFFTEREPHRWKPELIERFNEVAKGWVKQQ